MASKNGNKTQPTASDVSAFLDGLPSVSQKRDAQDLDAMFRAVTGEAPVLWGSSIVGYGSYHYTYASGREGDFMRVGFSPRKQNLTLYIMPGFGDAGDILSRLGPHRVGKSCLYIKRLSDVDRGVLEELIDRAWETMTARYPPRPPRER